MTTVALLHSPRPTSTPPELPDDAFEEYDRPETIAAVATALGALGVRVVPVVADRRLPWRLEADHVDLAFNLAEGVGRRCRAAVPAAVCELLGIPTTGSDALTLAVAQDKTVARRLVSPEVAVAPAVLLDAPADEARLATLHYPVVVKPNDEGSSKGIPDEALVADIATAVERSRALRARYGCPVLAEEFLPGSEVTVGIAGNGSGAVVIGLMEIAPSYDTRPFVYSLSVKRDWRRQVTYHVPPRLAADVQTMIASAALTAYRLLGCRDVARMDFRLDAGGTPRFLECNPLPGLDPENSDIVMLAAPRRSYDELVQGILLDAATRTGVRIA